MRRHRHRFDEMPPLYRARDGAILGVCKGLARRLDFPVGWMRFLTVVAALFTGFWPMVLAYIIAGMIMKPEPIIPFESEEDHEFYDSYVSSRSMALNRLKRTFDSLERRIARMENIVTARDYDWESRLKD